MTGGAVTRPSRLLGSSLHSTASKAVPSTFSETECLAYPRSLLVGAAFMQPRDGLQRDTCFRVAVEPLIRLLHLATVFGFCAFVTGNAFSPSTLYFSNRVAFNPARLGRTRAATTGPCIAISPTAPGRSLRGTTAGRSPIARARGSR